MYWLVDVQTRYVGAFVVLLWLGVFSGVRLRDSQESRRLAASVSVAILVIVIIEIGASSAQVLARGVLPDVQWEIAESLNRMGVRPGDKVGLIRSSSGPAVYWARLAKVQIVAEIPAREANSFWSASDLVRSQVIKTFARTGANFIIAEAVPSWVGNIGCQRIEKTNYCAYILPREAALSPISSRSILANSKEPL
jgi:hypothetical protein